MQSPVTRLIITVAISEKKKIQLGRTSPVEIPLSFLGLVVVVMVIVISAMIGGFSSVDLV